MGKFFKYKSLFVLSAIVLSSCSQVKPPNAIHTSAPDKPSTKSPESRLEELKSMYDKGLITKSEYDQKKKQILDQM